MRGNGYLWTSGVNLDNAVRFPDPDFPFECKILAIWRRFRWFLHFICRMFAIFLLPVCLTYWPRKYTTRVDPYVDNYHKVWSWYVHTLPSYSVFVCWYVTWPCDLDLRPFDLVQSSCMASHVTNFATKYEDPTPILSYAATAQAPNHVTRNRGSKTITYLQSSTRFAYSLYNFYWATTTIKGRLLSSRPMLMPFSGEKNFKSSRNGAQKWRF